MERRDPPTPPPEIHRRPRERSGWAVAVALLVVALSIAAVALLAKKCPPVPAPAGEPAGTAAPTQPGDAKTAREISP